MLIKWITSRNKFSKVVQCAMSKRPVNTLLLNPLHLLRSRHIRFISENVLGKSFFEHVLQVQIQYAYFVWFSKNKVLSTNDVTISHLITLYYLLSNNKAFWRPFLSVGICFFTYCHHNRSNIFHVVRLLNKFTKCISM